MRVDLLGLLVFTALVGAVNIMAPWESGLIPRVLSISSIVGEEADGLTSVEGGDCYSGRG